MVCILDISFLFSTQLAGKWQNEDGLKSDGYNFGRHPRQCSEVRLSAKKCCPLTRRETRETLAQTTIDYSCCLYISDKTLAQFTSKQFMESVLHKQLSALVCGRTIVLGITEPETFDDCVSLGKETGTEVSETALRWIIST